MIDLFRQALGQQLPQQGGQIAQMQSIPQMPMMPHAQQIMPPQFDPYGQQQTGLAQAIMRGLYNGR